MAENLDYSNNDSDYYRNHFKARKHGRHDCIFDGFGRSVFSIYGGIAIAQEIICLPQKRQIRQMECFASDLQGVLDLIKD